MATILIVDNVAIIRKLLVRLLGSQGHRMLEAGEGAPALALAQRERPDLVITDVLLPTLEGLAFVEQLRADPAIARTPVIFYTGSLHEEEVRALARVYGAIEVLIKPASLETVLRVIAAVLSRGTKSDSSPS